MGLVHVVFWSVEEIKDKADDRFTDFIMENDRIAKIWLEKETFNIFGFTFCKRDNKTRKLLEKHRRN